MWHKDLLGLDLDDHAQYALLGGRAGNQTLIGGLAAAERLYLQSTAHATRGVIMATDDLVLSTGKLKDPYGSIRLTLAGGNPHVALTGMSRLSGEVAIGGVAAVANKLLQVQGVPAPTTAYLRAIMGSPNANIPSGAAAGIVRGLEFTCGPSQGGGGAVVTEVSAIYAYPVSVFYTGTITEMDGLKVPEPLFFGGSPSVATFHGARFMGSTDAYIADAYGLRVGDNTNNSGFTRLLELGPATPYLRLVGGSAPAANFSNLYLNVGGTLFNVRERTVGGYRCLTIN